MYETINVIQQSLSEKKQIIRRLLNEQDKLVAALSENFSHRTSLSSSIQRQEAELKELCDLHYSRKSETNDDTNSKVACDDVVKAFNQVNCNMSKVSGANKDTLVSDSDLRNTFRPTY